MTLVIGIRCSDGIVVAADGAATLGTPGQTTVRQPVSKLRVIDGQVIFAASGPLHLEQPYGEEIEELWKGKQLVGLTPGQAARRIRDRLWPHCIREWQAAAVLRNAGHQGAIGHAFSQALVGMRLSGDFCLIQFNEQCSPELATDDLPFACVGSGQRNADPFLAFLRHIFWPQKVPRVADGLLAAAWTMLHSIRIEPGGVAEPVQIGAIDKSGKARILDRDELEETYQFISNIESDLAQVRVRLQSKEPVEPPPH